MGALSKQTGGGAALQETGGEGLGGLLGGLLGGDASDTMSDLVSLGKKFLQ